MIPNLGSNPVPARRPPFLTFLAFRYRPSAVKSFMVRFAVISIVVLAASKVGHTVMSGQSRRTFLNDMSRLLTLRKGKENASIGIGLLRDYSAWIHIVMIATMLSLLPDLLRSVDELLPNMERDGSLVYKPTSNATLRAKQEARVSSLIHNSSRFLQANNTHFVVLGIAALFTLLGSLGYKKFGIYPLFSNGGRNEASSYALAAYKGWWARPWGAGSIAWFIMALIGNFINLWIIVVSMTLFRAMFKLRTDMTYIATYLAQDGEWGWSSPSRLIETGRKTTTAGCFGILGLAIIANPDSATYFFLFIFGFLLALSFFLIPNRLYYSARELGEAEIKGLADPVQRTLLMKSLPREMVSVRTFLLQFFLTALPGVIQIFQFLNDK